MLRGVWRTFGRFLAIAAIIAISCAFYAGVRSAAPQMEKSAWDHIQESHLADVSVKSTLGFADDDLEYLLATQRSFDRGYQGYSADLITDGLRGECVIRLLSYDPSYGMDIPIVVEGRLPETAGEIAVDARQSDDLHLSVGDTLVLRSDDGDIADILKGSSFTVVGRITSPLWPTDSRGTSQAGTGEVTAFAYTVPDAFAYETYTDIYLHVKGTDDLPPFSKEYDDLVKVAADGIETAKQSIIDRRRDRIRADADAEMADARQQLADAKKEFDKGNEEYLSFLDAYNKAKEQIDAQKGQLFESTGDRDDSLRELDAEESRMNDLAATCDKVQRILDDYADTYLQALTPELLSELTSIQDLYFANSVDANMKDLLAVYIITDPASDPATRETARTAIVSLNEQVRSAAWTKIGQIRDQRDAIKDTGSELTSAGTDLITSQHRLTEAKRKLEEAERELSKGQQKLREAETELYDAQAQVEERIADGRLYVRDRNSFDPDPMSYGEDCERLDRIAAVFPVFFVLLAALVCCATMTRMVEEQRTQAGTIKALGYSTFSVILQYLLYAATATIFGCAIGLTVGFKCLPIILCKCYATMYRYPAFVPSFDKDIAIGCVIVSLLCTVLSALYACIRELTGMPAVLIRPKAPRSGKRILLERIKPIWSGLPFLHKVSFRNLFRYKSRFFLMVVGIGGCTALLLTGFGLKYGISAVLDRQYGDIFKFDMLVSLDEKSSLEEQAEISSALRSLDGYTDHMYAVMDRYDVTAGDETRSANVFCALDNSIYTMVDLRDAKTGSEILLYDDYAVITEKLAKLLNVKQGDKISIEGAGEIEIYAIAENHIDHYIYLTKNTYEQLFSIPKANTILVDMSGAPDRSARRTSVQKIIDCDGVLSAVYMTDGLQNFHDLLGSLDLIVGVVILFTGLLSLVILLNLANINITERRHELATIKVLGFFDSEVGAYVYRENLVTNVIGIILGLIVGISFERFVLITAEVDQVMFVRDLPPICFVMSAAMMVIFILIVNIVIFFKLRRIDMTSSMKAVE